MADKISVAITTYNRVELTLKSFYLIVNNPRIEDICIIDDHSTSVDITPLFDAAEKYNNVWLTVNEKNYGMMLNKLRSLQFCNCNHVLMADSDNIFDYSYLEALPEKLDPGTIYMPDFAEPNFDFTEFSGLIFDKTNVKQYMDDPKFHLMLNTCNYVVPKFLFIDAFIPNETIKGSDTIWLNYCALKYGLKFHVVPKMKYYHLVHKDSTWLQDADYNLAKADEIIKLIKEL